LNIYFAEYIGTALLILFGGGVCAGVSLNKSYAQNSGWIVISIGWGMAVTFAIYAVGDISGAHINPAVTLGLAMVGSFPWEHVAGYMVAQVLGGMTGAALVWLHYLPHWKATEDKATKLGIFSTSPAMPSRFANLWSEMMGTFILLFALSYIGLNDFSDGLNPLVVGGLIVAIGVSLGGTTGYAINPARDLGPRIAHFLLPIAGKGDSNWKYSWIPVIGPLLGGALGALSFQAIFNQLLGTPFYLCLVLTVGVMILAIKEQTEKHV
jgi:glycerol uptake facilitator protein